MENNVSDDYIKNELKKFNITDAAIIELKNMFMHLFIDNIDDKEGFKNIKNSRIKVKNYRIDVEKRRKELISDSLKFQRAINDEAKRIIGMLIPIEDHLSSQEEYYIKEIDRIKREKQELENLKIRDRVKNLLKFDISFDGVFYFSECLDVKINSNDLKNFSDSYFLILIEDISKKYNDYQDKLCKQKEEKKKEEDRINKIREEKIKIDEENSRLEIIRLKKIEDEQEKERIRLNIISIEQQLKERAIKDEQERIYNEKINKDEFVRIEKENIKKEKQNYESEILEKNNKDFILSNFNSNNTKNPIVYVLMHDCGIPKIEHIFNQEKDAEDMLKTLGDNYWINDHELIM
jgi:hypothetical protein